MSQLTLVLRRCCSGRAMAARLWNKYECAKERVTHADHALKGMQLNPRSVFANNELDLSEITAYGFDYDYTIAVYTKDVNVLTYNLALTRLVEHHNYPADIRAMPYDPTFAVRGLHYDIQKGLLLKLDAYCQVQLGSVHRGRRKLPDAEVKRLYNGTYIPRDVVENHHNSELKQLLDLFSLPEVGLLSNVAEHFIENGIQFHPQSLYQDVTEAVRHVHVQGHLYRSIVGDMERFVHPSPLLAPLLQRLAKANKTIFLLTNSPFPFVNCGMTYLIGTNWTEYFDFIVTKSRKPAFFDDNHIPFRVHQPETNSLSWEPVHEIKRGVVYAEGNFNDFVDRSGLRNQHVLYFGDHLYSDLAEPILKRGWRTAAVVPELEREIEIEVTESFSESLLWLQALGILIDRYQDLADSSFDCKEVISAWRMERRALRGINKDVFNPNFGSIFRTHNNPTYFTRRFVRLADVYTSNVTNFLQYSLNHTFYPRRVALPHEPQWWPIQDP